MLTAFASGLPAREADAALKSASSAEAAARQCAVLWFGEILERRLYRDLGYSSMPAYARAELGYSETRIGDFMRLVQKLQRLPAVKEARTTSRAQLVQKVRRVKAQASARPAATLFAPPTDEPLLAREVPVHVSVEFTPEQHARWEVLWEQARTRGAAGDRAEVLLDALQCLVASHETAGANADITPRGVSTPPVQIHVHQCPDCGQVEVNGRGLGRADAERIHCDAAVAEPGARNTTTIAPKTRRDVLARDRHRCQAPGCGRTRFLEVHHMKARARGGTHEPANLITLCASCHRLWHERQ